MNIKVIEANKELRRISFKRLRMETKKAKEEKNI